MAAPTTRRPRLRLPRPAPDAPTAPAGRPRLRGRVRLPRLDGPLVVLMIVAAVGAIAWSFVVPAMEGPDEEAHIAYVQRLVEDHHLPQQVDSSVDGYSTELERSQYWAQLYQVATNPAVKPLL